MCVVYINLYIDISILYINILFEHIAIRILYLHINDDHTLYSHILFFILYLHVWSFFIPWQRWLRGLGCGFRWRVCIHIYIHTIFTHYIARIHLYVVFTHYFRFVHTYMHFNPTHGCRCNMLYAVCILQYAHATVCTCTCIYNSGKK